MKATRAEGSAIATAPERPFDEVAATLRRELVESSAAKPARPLGWKTIEINSGLVEQRGEPIVKIACDRLGMASLSGIRLIDLGCGYGGLTALFAVRGAAVVAVDPNAARIDAVTRVAERHALDVRAMRGRMQRLDVPDESFDVAVMNNSFIYLVDPAVRARALAEAKRVVVPGGVLVMLNANRLHPIDPFTGLPLLHLLTPVAAARVAKRLDRRRSRSRPRSPHATSRELRTAGFTGVRHHATNGRVPGFLKAAARFTLLSAVRPT